MTDDVFDSTKLSRRSLLVGGGLATAGLTTLGAPSLALGANRRATDTIRFAMITHGDTGSFWSVFKKGVDQASSDSGPRIKPHSQARANNNVAQQAPTSTRRSLITPT
jgi:ABC-type sugar transport system substrate-binding protein